MSWKRILLKLSVPMHLLEGTCVPIPIGRPIVETNFSTSRNWQTFHPGSWGLLQGNVKEHDRSGEQSLRMELEELQLEGLKKKKKMELINVLAGTEQGFMSLLDCRGFVLHQYLLVRLSD